MPHIVYLNKFNDSHLNSAYIATWELTSKRDLRGKTLNSTWLKDPAS